MNLNFITSAAADRFDLGVKLEYARQLKKFGFVAPPTLRTYLTHIALWNSFIELPEKHSPDCFIRRFDDLIRAASSPDFDGYKCSLPITSDGRLINGAHRLAAALASGNEHKLLFDQVDSPYRYSSSFFSDYTNPHSGARFSSKILDDMYEDFVAVVDHDYYLLTPRAIAEDGGKRAISIISKTHRINHIRRFNIAHRMVPLLVSHMYWNQDWISAGFVSPHASSLLHKANSIIEPYLPNRFTLILVNPCADDQKISVKHKIRQAYSSRQDSVHSSDLPIDTKILGLLVATLDRASNSLVTNSYFNDCMRLLRDNSLASTEIKIDYAITGSFLLGLNNLRDVNDIDLIGRTGEAFSHNNCSYYYSQSPEELIYNKENYYYLFGQKILVPEQIYSLKQRRAEPKDFTDIALLATAHLAPLV